MSAVVRTAYSGLLSTCKLLGLPYTPPQYSTLNELFSVNVTNETFSPADYPNLRYMAIGNKGATYDTSTSGYILTNPMTHLPRHAGLYNPIPFRVVKKINDSPSVAAKYRMRVPVTVEGVEYIAYYLKVLDMTAVTPKIELRNVDGENITTVQFDPTQSDLSPTHPNLSNVDLNDPSGDYLIPTARVNFNLTTEDINYIIEACTILFGDPRFAVINEIAVCTGKERSITATFTGGSSNYLDVVCAQVAAFIYQYSALNENSTGVNITMDVGSSELLRIL